MRPRVIHTPLLFWADGFTVSPHLVLIHSRRRGDEVLLAHELVHCRQMRETGWLRFALRYLLQRDFRLRMEVEAYRESIAQGASPARCARALARGYRLGITTRQARRLLSGLA
jgi:hypothetical protein